MFIYVHRKIANNYKPAEYVIFLFLLFLSSFGRPLN